ncbi:unnamed protein product [Ambrosiozyma monospora]|uniref:Unnamed protein product n=1 Tax=Ambrosiozyma monospora TaxID=43982 RepID=A0ACB5TVY0_AMBMO|nr:unnamed protein product [Ambrosiozyma monospora]
MMLAGVKYDLELLHQGGRKVRVVAEELYNRCKLLCLLETAKVTLMQSYLLMSTHEEGSEGANQSRQFVSKASMICAELSLPVMDASNFGSSTSTTQNGANSSSTSDDTTSKSNKNTQFYSRGLLRRLFWVSYTADRIHTVTSSSQVFYHYEDMLIAPPELTDFPESQSTRFEDFTIFSKWYSLVILFEKVLFSCYRPPMHRAQDENFERDMLKWGENTLSSPEVQNIPSNFLRFLKINYGLCNILYLRCKVDFVTFLDNATDENYVESEKYPISSNKMYYINKFNKMILDSILTDPPPRLVPLPVVHAIVHVMVMIHLELQSKGCSLILNTPIPSDTTDQGQRASPTSTRFKSNNIQQEHQSQEEKAIKEDIALKQTQFSKCLAVLAKLKCQWWYAAASFFLFKAVLDESGSMIDTTGTTTENATSENNTKPIESNYSNKGASTIQDTNKTPHPSHFYSIPYNSSSTSLLNANGNNFMRQPSSALIPPQFQMSSRTNGRATDYGW